MTSGMVTARSFASRNHYEIDVDREFVAIGASNVAAGLSQGFAVTGADSRTAVSDSDGRQDAGDRAGRRGGDGGGPALLHRRRSSSCRAAPWAPCSSPPGSGLFDWRALVRFRRIGEGELLVCVTAMLGVVALGALNGHRAGRGAGDARAAHPVVAAGRRRAGAADGPGRFRRSRQPRGRRGAARSAALSLRGVGHLLQRRLLQASARWRRSTPRRARRSSSSTPHRSSTSTAPVRTRSPRWPSGSRHEGSGW